MNTFTKTSSAYHGHNSPILLFTLLLLSILTPGSASTARAATNQRILQGPEGSAAFGSDIVLGANGTFLVTDPGYDANGLSNVGAIFLYDSDYSLISMLTGSHTDDRIGKKGWALSNGNFVVSSYYWNQGRGAVTWINGTTGLNGIVSEENSLVGSHINDYIGWVTLLTNGNYVVSSNIWDNGTLENAGAVTWGNGMGGTVGEVSATNSLVGGYAHNWIGCSFTGEIRNVIALDNGNYVVTSPYWGDDSSTLIGAVTWGNGMGGTVGEISPANSLLGNHQYDNVGFWVEFLPNSNYVVRMPDWDGANAKDAGAVSWGNGMGGTVGEVSATNSLIGSHADDKVGRELTILSNGNYVVSSPTWDNEDSPDVGAATWGSGSSGVVGTINATNSLIGNHAYSYVGMATALANGNYVVRGGLWEQNGTTRVGALIWANGAGGTVGEFSTAKALVSRSDGGLDYIFPLKNGNYVVLSQYWDNGSIADAGAITWGDGTGKTVGVISPSNSLIGSHTNDGPGFWILPLPNGNYVVTNPYWDSDNAINAGSVTWGSGVGPTVGVISASNSLVGSQLSDAVGSLVTLLDNSNYVVRSPSWSNGNIPGAGAVTWGNGMGGTVGEVSATNSLVGNHPGDNVGAGYIRSDSGVLVLRNSNYVVVNPLWDSDQTTNVGSVTWANGTGGTVGTIGANNSVVGSHEGDLVGYEVTALDNGNYVISSPDWDNNTLINTGAVTWGNGISGTSGIVSVHNSLIGGHDSDRVGSNTILPLTNGNYIVRSPAWSNTTMEYAGAVTWGNGMGGTVGEVGINNSLVGSHAGDQVGISEWGYYNVTGIEAGFQDSKQNLMNQISDGSAPIINGMVSIYRGIEKALPNGDALLYHPTWANGDISIAGAITFFDGKGGMTGEISLPYNILGSVSGHYQYGPYFDKLIYDEVHNRLFVGKSNENKVFIIEHLSITSETPPAGTVGTPYSHTFTTQAAGTLTYSVTEGNLPPGLTLSPQGVLSGTPTATGSFSFTVTVSNGSMQDSQKVTIAIVAQSERHLYLPSVRG